MGDFTADPDEKAGLKKGKKSDGKAKEGKVAGTDNYGEGGPQAKGNAPGKSSGTEHLPDGPNGATGQTIGQQNGVNASGADAKEKQPNSPTGGGKGTAGDKDKDGKHDKSGAGAKDGKDSKQGQANHVAGADGKKDAAGKEAPKAAARAPTQQGPTEGKPDKAPAPMYAGKPAAPALKVDASVAPPIGEIKVAALPPIGKALADKWIKETGRPPEVHWVQIQGAVSILSSDVQRAQNEFKTYSDTAAQKLQAELDGKTTTFASTVTGPGRQRVTAAYTTMNKTVETSSQKALTDIAAHKQNGTKQIQTTLPAKKTEVTKKLEAAKTTVKTLIDKHSPVATKEIQAFGTKVTPEIETRKKDANEKAKKEAEKFDPKAGNGDQRGGSALEGGKLSLKNDVYNQLIMAEGKKLGDEYDGTLRPVITDIEKQAPKWVATEVSDQIGTLTAILDSYDKTTVSGVDKTGKDTTAQLDAQEVTAKKSVADAKTSSLKKIETEQKNALEAADAAGKDLLDNTKQAGAELIDRLKKKAADDSKMYATVTAGLDKTLQKRGPHRFESIQPQIDAAKQQLAKLGDANKQSLDQMANQGMIDLSAAITKNQDIYQQAIKNREEQAVKVELEIKKDVSKGADDLGATLSGIGTAFTDTVTKETAKIDTAVAQFNTTADAGLKDFSTKLKGKLDKIQTDANAAFDEGFKAKFAEKDKLVQAAEETIKAKEKAGVTDAGKMRGAFDGYGTDEEMVFSLLRTRTYGEIEFLQGAYNHHYDNRGQAKTTKFAGKEMKLGSDSKLTPLKYDIDDEMSGSDFKIAMAYLEHHRQDAIQLEIKDASGGMFGTDGKRVEAVLRTCNDEEIHHLNTDESAKRTLMVARTMMFDQCNTDVMDTLLDEKVKKEERASKADAIRLFDAMKGPGTDEAKMTEIFEGAQTDEQRAALRKNFNEYAAKRGWATGDSKDENNDALALAIKDDTSDGEQAVFLEQAKVHRDEGMLKMAKAYKAADGGGTDEALLFESLEDDHYAEEWEKAKPEERAAIEAAHKKLLDGRLSTLTGSKGKDRGTIDGLIEDETTKAPFTWQELLDGKKKDGTAIDVAQWKVLLRDLQSGFLEYLLAERTLQIGRLDPTLALAYACWGVAGTDEELINKAISRNGEPLAQKAVKKIKSDFRVFWGVNLVDNEDEFARPTKDPGGLLSAELGGKDWFKTRILLCGIPENAKQEHYVNNLRFDYASSGALGGVFMDAMEAVGATETKSTAEHSRKREQEAYQQNFVDKKIEEKSYEDIRKEADQASKDDQDPAKKKDPRALQEALQNAKNVDEFLLLSKEMEIDATAYAETKSALIDAVITTLEVIGGVLISIGTMGAGSPILAAFLANLAMSAGGIILKAAIKGDQYGSGDFATDAIAAIGSAGFGALGETKAVLNAAEGVGKRLTGTVFKAAEEGLQQGGVQVAKVGGKWGIELSKEGMAKVERIVAAGAKNVMMSTGQEVYGFVTDEKTYDMKIGEALWGENSLGKRILAGAPRAFATGAVSDWINQYAHTSTLDYPKGTPGSAMKNALWNAVAEMGGNTAGFFLYPDNYESSEHFWKELFKSNVQSGLTGFASGYLMHKNRHKKLAAEFIRGELDHDGLMNLVHDKTLDNLEQQKLAEFVMAHGTDEAKAALPEHYKKLIGAKPQLPVADPNAPAATMTAPTAGASAPDVKKTAPPDNAGNIGDPSPVEPIEHKAEQKKPATHDEEKKQQAQAKVDEAKNQAPEQQPSTQTATEEPKPVVHEEKKTKPGVAANDNEEHVDDHKAKGPAGDEDQQADKKAKAATPDDETEQKKLKQAAADKEEEVKKAALTEDADKTKKAPAGDEETKKKAAADEEKVKKAAAEAQAKQIARDERIKEQKEEKGHASIEVHSHFLGNVEPTQFRKVMAESGMLEMKPGDTTTWEPVLREIIALEKQPGFAHTYKKTEAGEVERDPKTNKPIVASRGNTGDAIAQAKEAIGRIDALKKQLEDPQLSPKQREKIKDKIYRQARSAAEKALRASDETDFNSSYEVRDELIKKFYGEADRKAILGDTKDEKFTTEVADKYRQHFEENGRPEVVKKIEAAEAAQKKLDAEPNLPEKEQAKLKAQIAAVSQQLAYDRFAKDTVLRLVQDGLTYTEQSNSAKKLAERFDPQQIDQIKRALIAEHPDLKEKIEAFEVKHVAMLNTASFGVRGNKDDGVDTSDIHDASKGTRHKAQKELAKNPKAVEEEEQAFKDAVKGIVKQTQRKDVVGVDIAGAETFTFDEKGAERFGYLYEELRKEAVLRGEPIVLRPHVGEGANDPVSGKHFARDTDRQMDDGQLSHYKRAKDNIDALLKTLEGIATQRGENGKLPKDVIVRFGHATHATPEQAARMAKLGIIAEVNLSSNVETGSASQRKPKSATEDNQHGKDEHYPLKDSDQKRGGKLEDHSLANLILNDVPIILSTDGHSVMSTSMKREYDLANKQIDKILAGKQRIPFTEEQARALGVHESKLATDAGGVVHIKITDIPEGKRGAIIKKFEDARHKFYEDANNYYDQRPKQGPGPQMVGGTPQDPSPSDMAVKKKLDHLDELNRKRNSSDPDERARAEQELGRLKADPEWADALKLKGVFELASAHQEHEAGKIGPDNQLVSNNINAILDEQKKVRQGVDPVLQAKREKFERAIALAILDEKSPVRKAVDTELDKLCAKALDYIEKTRPEQADQVKAIRGLGTDKSKGYGGALGNDDAVMMDVLKHGNIRERMLALGKFMEMIGNDALTNNDRIKGAGFKSKDAGDDNAYTKEMADKLLARAEKYREANPTPKKDIDKEVTAMFKPDRDEADAANNGRHAEYQAAKDQNMDTKLPAMVTEKVNEFLGKQSAAGSDMAAKGEKNPVAVTNMTVREAMKKGLALSDREIAAAGGMDAPLNWVVGQTANILDPNADFVKDARNRSMPLKAGISGTTYRWMQVVDLLGGNPDVGRLAAIASLQAADAHSFHEIAVASKGFGVKYNPDEPYANVGLPQEQLNQLAASVGTSLDELNGKKPDAKPSP